MTVEQTMSGWVAGLAILFSLLSWGVRPQQYEFALDDQPEMPIKIRRAYLVERGDGAYEFHLTAENTGQLGVATFALSFPFGLFDLGYGLQGGERKEIEVTLPQDTSARLREMIARGKLRGFTMHIKRLHWSQEAGEPISLDIMTVVDAGVPVEVSFSSQALSFPREPTGDAVSSAPATVLWYAEVPVKIHSLATGPRRSMRFELDGTIAGRWRRILNGSLGALLRPGKTRLTYIRFPVEVLNGGLKERFEHYRVRVTGVISGRPEDIEKIR